MSDLLANSSAKILVYVAVSTDTMHYRRYSSMAVK